jgi:hypothetical protein
MYVDRLLGEIVKSGMDGEKRRKGKHGHLDLRVITVRPCPDCPVEKTDLRYVISTACSEKSLNAELIFRT